MKLNDWLDSLPRTRVNVHGTLLPIYFVIGLAGVGVGFIALINLTLWTGRSLPIADALAAVAALAFICFLRLRAVITGMQKIILIECVVIVDLAAWGMLELAGVAVLPHLDLLNVALATFMTFGRIGCLLCGCCYGIPAPIGVRYPLECGHAHGPRRLPVQLIEIVAWALLALLGALAVLGRDPGTATAMIAGSYGALRLMLEPLRDDHRPRFLGFTEATWLSVGLLLFASYLSYRSSPIDLALLGGSVATALAIVVGLKATRHRWLVIENPGQETEIISLGKKMRARELGSAPVVEMLGELSFGASRSERDGDSAISVSVSCGTRLLDRAEATQLLGWMLRGLGVEHDEVRLVQSPGGVFVATSIRPH